MTIPPAPSGFDDDPEAEFAALIDGFNRLLTDHGIEPGTIRPTREGLLFASLCANHLATVASIWQHHTADPDLFDAAGIDSVTLDELDRTLETALGWDPDR